MRLDFIEDTKRTDSAEVKNSSKEAILARKILNTAKSKHGSLESVLKYDIIITSYNSLFDGIYMTKTTNKAQLITELEEFLSSDHYDEEIPLSTTLVVDFMSYVRNQVINANIFDNFENLVTSLYNWSSNACPNDRESRGTSSLELTKNRS